MQVPPTYEFDTAAHHLVTKFEADLGAAAVLTGDAIKGSFVQDWARDRVGKCLAIIRPNTVDGVRHCMKLCAKASVGIIPQGGHTGLVGGAQRDVADCVLISTSRLNSIREIDTDNMTATVEAGVVLETLHNALAEHDLEFPVGIGSQGTAQIGGIVSTNAGGSQVVRHGMTREHVLGLEMVLADGNVVSSMTNLHKDNRGPDPLRMAIGGEGTFGVVTAVSLRLVPKETSTSTAYVGCQDFEAALKLLRHIRAGAYEFLTGFEVMSQDCLLLALLVDPKLTPPVNAPVQVLIRLGSVALLPLEDMLNDLLAQMLEESIVQDAVVAQSSAQAARFWALREGLVEGQSKRGYHVRSDVSVNIGEVPNLIAALSDMLQAEFPNWVPQAYGHMGDGNVHFNALPPEGMNAPEARVIGPAIEKRIFEIALAHNGSYSAEHGIGRTKRSWFAKTTEAEKLALLARVKRAYDPEFRMNPGCLIADQAEVAS